MRVAGVARSTRRERDRRMADDRRRDADTALGDRPRRLRQQPRTAPRPLREPGHGPHPAGLQGRWQEQLARRRRGPNVPCRGLTPDLATPHPGPSPNREWMISRTRPITHSGNGNRGTATPRMHPHRTWSPTRVPPRSGPAKLDLPDVPSLDLRSEPEAGSTTAEVEDWTRHVRVPVEILAHGVAVGEPKDPSDVVCVDEIIDEHAAGHESSLHVTADEACACKLSVRRVR